MRQPRIRGHNIYQDLDHVIPEEKMKLNTVDFMWTPSFLLLMSIQVGYLRVLQDFRQSQQLEWRIEVFVYFYHLGCWALIEKRFRSHRHRSLKTTKISSVTRFGTLVNLVCLICFMSRHCFPLYLKIVLFM